MNKIIFLLAFVALIGCNKEDIAPNTPDCIRNEIRHQSNNWTIGSVDEYFFQGQLVYAYAPDERIIADGSTTIKDANCNTLCSVGGFGGPTINQCNGTDFFQSATLKRNIWRKK